LFAARRDAAAFWSGFAVIYFETANVQGAEESQMENHIFTTSSPQLSQKRSELAPDTDRAFREFSKQVFADGALSSKVKQIIAVAVAHVTQCPYCIRGHTQGALRKGASEKEIMEAIWVAAEMRAGGAFAHSVIALEAMQQAQPK
jgi:AhpD family alkylhydroperoxidase